MRQYFSSRSRPLLLSLALHALLLCFFISSQTNTHYRTTAQQVPHTRALEAMTIDPTHLAQAVGAIQAERAEKKHLAQQQLQHWQHQLNSARHARRAEQKHLAHLKLQKAHLKKEQAHLKIERDRLNKAQNAKRQALAKQTAQTKKQAKKLEQIQKQLHQAQAQALNNKQAKLQKIIENQQLADEKAKIDAENARVEKGILNEYRAKILQAIRLNWHPNVQKSDHFTQLLVELAPGGTVTDVSILKSSGDHALDRFARLALYKASPLPVPGSPALFEKFSRFRIKMSPKSVTG